jgi:hypothetical protein
MMEGEEVVAENLARGSSAGGIHRQRKVEEVVADE